MDAPNPMNLTEDRRRSLEFAGAADECRAAADLVDRALAESKVLADLHERVTEAIATCLATYRDFEVFRSQVDAAWSKDADLYDEGVHRQLRRSYGNFRQVFDVLATAISSCDRIGVGDLPGANEVREIRETMASVEMMDFGPMPEHMERLTLAAVRSYASGEDQGE